jgi:toxin-antitoxin system PIN domain toxin
VALAWNRHIHHAAILRWFDGVPARPWATCPVTEAGFVRVSSNARAVGAGLSAADARAVLRQFRSDPGHRFLPNDVSMTDGLVPVIAGHRQVTDALLLGVARRHRVRLVTFDAALAALGAEGEVEVLVP